MSAEKTFGKWVDAHMDKSWSELSDSEREQLKTISPSAKNMVQNIALCDAMQIHQMTAMAASNIISAAMHVITKQILECKTLDEIHSIFNCYQRERTEKEPPQERKEES